MPFQQRLEVLRSRSGIFNEGDAILMMARSLLQDSGLKKPPFSPERFCEIACVEVARVELNDCDARLLPVSYGYIAEVQSSHSRRRQNYSICHEIGHTFFAYKGQALFDDVSCAELDAD